MTAYLREAEATEFTAAELLRLEAALQQLQRDLVVLPIASLSDVVVDAAGKLACGYRMQESAVMALAELVSPGLVTLLRDLTQDGGLPWRSYRDLLQICFEQRWSLVGKLVLYGTRHTRIIDTVGYRVDHVDLLEAYEAAKTLGSLHSARLQGRRLQLWTTARMLCGDYCAGHVLEAEEGGRGSWRVSKAILTPFGGVVAGARTASGKTLLTRSLKDRVASLNALEWTNDAVMVTRETITQFLETSLSHVLAGTLSARYKLRRRLVVTILRRCARQRQPLTGEVLLRMALMHGALPLQISVFTDTVRRSAYYWLTSR